MTPGIPPADTGRLVELVRDTMGALVMVAEALRRIETRLKAIEDRLPPGGPCASA